MGIFRKKLPKILDDPILVDLYVQLEKVKNLIDAMSSNETKEAALSIALECDLRLQNALNMIGDVDFSRYKIDFKLIPVKFN